MNCSSDLKNFENSRPSASNFKSFSRSLEQFFLTLGQNNFGNKIPLPFSLCILFQNDKVFFKENIETKIGQLFLRSVWSETDLNIYIDMLLTH